MSRKSYKTESSYREAKVKEYYRYYASTALYKKRKWDNPDDDDLVLSHDIPDMELSKKIGRSVKAIQHRRSRLLANKVSCTK